MSQVDLQTENTAVALLKQKYPQLEFTPSFEECVGGTRGIFDIRINPVTNPSDSWTYSLIAPNNMATAAQYVQSIEAFLEPRFGIVPMAKP